MTIDPQKVAAAKARTRDVEARFKPMTIGELVTERCLALGDRVAIDVFDRGERATYSDVERLSNRIGNALLSLGIAKGQRVGVMLPNRLAYPLTWFALAKIGAIHVPINTRYTPREIEYVIRDSGASALVIDAQFLDAFRAVEQRPPDLTDSRVVVVGGKPPAGMRSFEDLVSASSEAACLDRSLTPGDIVNIQYTSGTTGFPKGCMQPHEYWVLMSWAMSQWSLQALDRHFTAQPFFYMHPQWQILKTFRHGGTLFMAPQLSASRFIGWLKQYRIEWCQFPELMTRQPEEPDDAQTALKEVLGLGWGRETYRAFKKRFGRTPRDGFGMTEVGLATWTLPEVEEVYDACSVGLDAPFRETTIRDEAGNPLPPGEVGELWIRGRAIFKGYWNKPEANADAFRDGGWFRTGDLFRADEQGFLWLVGRLKDMIRRSAENIAAREVESIVRELPQVEDCAAVPVPDPRRGEEVKIYVQLKEGIAPDQLPAADIHRHCTARLARFKVPRYYAYIERFPRTSSNKIEKRNLVATAPDLRAGAWDADENVWR